MRNIQPNFKIIRYNSWFPRFLSVSQIDVINHNSGFDIENRGVDINQIFIHPNICWANEITDFINEVYNDNPSGKSLLAKIKLRRYFDNETVDKSLFIGLFKDVEEEDVKDDISFVLVKIFLGSSAELTLEETEIFADFMLNYSNGRYLVFSYSMPHPSNETRTSSLVETRTSGLQYALSAILAINLFRFEKFRYDKRYWKGALYPILIREFMLDKQLNLTPFLDLSNGFNNDSEIYLPKILEDLTVENIPEELLVSLSKIATPQSLEKLMILNHGFCNYRFLESSFINFFSENPDSFYWFISRPIIRKVFTNKLILDALLSLFENININCNNYKIFNELYKNFLDIPGVLEHCLEMCRNSLIRNSLLNDSETPIEFKLLLETN